MCSLLGLEWFTLYSYDPKTNSAPTRYNETKFECPEQYMDDCIRAETFLQQIKFA